MAKNFDALRQWIKDHRPDMLKSFDDLERDTGEMNPIVDLMLIGFEAGRKFQIDNPDVVEGPIAY